MSELPRQGLVEFMIGKGLGPAARYILAVFAALFGVIMVLSAPLSIKPIPQYAFAFLCFSIAAACVTRGRVRQFIGSFIGLTIFASAVLYLVTEAVSGAAISSSSGPSLLGAVMYMTFFGAPALAYVWQARFGVRRERRDVV